ncbi:MAG: twin-arginine translocation signal domain-containing protein [Cocleimonas sp.]
MSKLNNTLTRRNFLKGAAYTSALSIGCVSSVAFATCGNKTAGMSASTSSVTLFNQSDKTVALNTLQPVSLEKVNGWVVVKINKASDQSIIDLDTDAIITLTAGQQLAFTVNSELAPMLKESGDLIVITNEYSALNNMVPVSTYDALVA